MVTLGKAKRDLLLCVKRANFREGMHINYPRKSHRQLANMAQFLFNSREKGGPITSDLLRYQKEYALNAPLFHVLGADCARRAHRLNAHRVESVHYINAVVQRGYGVPNSQTKVFSVTLAPNLPFQSRLGDHLMQKQHNVQRRAEAQGRQEEMTGRSFSNGRHHKACAPQKKPKKTRHANTLHTHQGSNCSP